MKPRVKLKGKQSVLKRLKKISDRYPRATAAAIYQEGMAIMAESQKLVPVNTGRLRSTAYVAPPKQKGNNTPTVQVGYGTKYAIYQHERTELNHPGHGEAKFLQKAIDKRSSGFANRLGKRIAQNVKKGIGVDAIKEEFPSKPTEGGAGQIVQPGRNKEKYKR